MASIQKRDSGRWRARYRDRAGKEHARHFTRKVDAQRWLDEVTADVLTGRYVDPKAGRITFAKWFEDWSGRQVWVDGTLVAARQAADSVPFGSVRLDRITPADVQGWVKAMTQPAGSEWKDGRPGRKTGLAASTIQVRFNYVHMCLRAAVAEKRLAEDPSADVRLPRQARAATRMQIPTPDEVRRVLDAAPEHFQAFIAVCAFAGLRLGEAAGLQVGDVDFLGRTLTIARQVQGQTRAAVTVVAPKAASGRTVPIPDELTTMLAAHLREVGVIELDGAQWLFTAGGGHLLNRNSAGNLWRQAAAAAGVTGYTLHDCRHFYASALIAAGCDVVTVQRALGHAQASITLDTYSHLWPNAEDRTRSAVRGLMRSTLGLADSGRTLGREPASG